MVAEGVLTAESHSEGGPDGALSSMLGWSADPSSEGVAIGTREPMLAVSVMSVTPCFCTPTSLCAGVKHEGVSQTTLKAMFQQRHVFYNRLFQAASSPNAMGENADGTQGSLAPKLLYNTLQTHVASACLPKILA